MFIIDSKNKRATPVAKKTFAELGFLERQDLQEWICGNPEILGEKLLIIQKEFAGFSDTNERLDLLALDTEGNLVIIENKLDDSGRDVVWQALKYVSYCALLKKSEICDIYQKHLGSSSVASEKICEFLKELLSRKFCAWFYSLSYIIQAINVEFVGFHSKPF
ncbi:MAG: endonuclease NucS, partial [Eubacteriaceae bacterium]|nr:endonuclease NucS [Eubacteriaceae bacterium]